MPEVCVQSQNWESVSTAIALFIILVLKILKRLKKESLTTPQPNIS